MNPLQKYANNYVEAGWTIGSMTDHQFIATRRKGMGFLVALIGIVGLLFYLIPGLLILLLGYVARGTETKIVTDADAQAWLTQGEQEDQQEQAAAEARNAAKNKRIAELSGSPLRFWYMMTDEQRGLLVILIVVLIILLLGNLAS